MLRLLNTDYDYRIISTKGKTKRKKENQRESERDRCNHTKSENFTFIFTSFYTFRLKLFKILGSDLIKLMRERKLLWKIFADKQTSEERQRDKVRGR